MIKIGYKQCQTDHTLFVKRQGQKVTTLIIYVDDTMVIENDEVEIA